MSPLRTAASTSSGNIHTKTQWLKAASARLVARRARPAQGLLADEQTDLWTLGKDE